MKHSFAPAFSHLSICFLHTCNPSSEIGLALEKVADEFVRPRVALHGDVKALSV